MNPGRITVLALAFLSSSCATTGLIGVPESQLLASWGAPDRIATLSDGSRVDTWLTDWNDKDGMHTCRKTFTVDSQGKVVRESLFDCTPNPVHDFGTSLIAA